MELLDLQIVVAVADSGSISGAAARLYLGQPAVSMRIKALEEELSQPLFVRGRRGVQPTPAGETLVKGARRTLAVLQATQNAVQESRLRPRVTISAPASVAAILLPPIVRQLAVDVDASVTTEHSHIALARLVDGSIDAAIILGGTIPPGHVATPLKSVPIIPVASPHHGPQGRPLALTDLRGYPIAHYHFSHEADDLKQRLTAALGPLNGATNICPAQMARYFALQGYITFLPEVAVAEELRSGMLVPLDIPELPTYYWDLSLVHRARKQLPPGIAALRTALGVLPA